MSTTKGTHSEDPLAVVVKKRDEADGASSKTRAANLSVSLGAVGTGSTTTFATTFEGTNQRQRRPCKIDHQIRRLGASELCATRDILFLIRKSRRLGDSYGSEQHQQRCIVSVSDQRRFYKPLEISPSVAWKNISCTKGCFHASILKEFCHFGQVDPQDHLLSALPKFRNKQIYLHTLSSCDQNHYPF